MDMREILGLSPFDPQKNKPVSLPGGGYATEYSATGQDGSGSWMVYPQIWWDQGGNPRLMSGDMGLQAASIYEMAGNKPFPRFKSQEEADSWAASRSAHGGGTKGKIVEALIGSRDKR